MTKWANNFYRDLVLFNEKLTSSVRKKERDFFTSRMTFILKPENCEHLAQNNFGSKKTTGKQSRRKRPHIPAENATNQCKAQT